MVMTAKVAGTVGNAKPFGAVALEGPDTEVEAIVASRVGGVNHRQALGSPRGQHSLNRWNSCVPRLRTAGIAPLLDRVDSRLFLVSAKVVVDVNHQQCRPLAEASTLTPASYIEYLSILV